MSTHHQIRLAVARCVSLLQRYRDGDQTSATKAMMIAEVDVIVGWLLEIDLEPGRAEIEILRLVEEHLLDRYGLAEGGQLNGEFAEAFDGNGIFENRDGGSVYILYQNKLFRISSA